MCGFTAFLVCLNGEEDPFRWPENHLHQQTLDANRAQLTSR
jgi:hypothetical protein